ncbi:MAG: fibronectin type III domain-containing protein [Clostridia bacterium]|nr:fibronectin type III domain-containing protein [Clostridia bacterium]MBR6315262.1 fibronectin type III domain-containing protein [Clostridia bacterium]
MKPRTILKGAAALCLCVLCLCVFLLPAAAAKKGTTSFRHSSVKVKLAYTHTVYSGKAKTPAVTVKHDGKVLKEDKHYTLRYKDNVEVGDATVIIKAKDGSGYTGKRVYTFSIVPKKVEQPTLVKATETSVKFRWTPVKSATGYVVYFYNAITNSYKKIKATHKTAMTVDGLQPDTTYLFCVRAYTLTDRNRLYGKYSAWLNARTKAAVPQGTKAAAVRAVIESGVYTLAFTADRGLLAGKQVTVWREGDNLAVETRIGGNRLRMLRRDDDLFVLMPARQRYTRPDPAMFEEALQETAADELLQDLLGKTDGAPQRTEVRSGKTLLQRELYRAEDGTAFALDFDGDALVRAVYYSADGDVNVTAIHTFSPAVPLDIFEIPPSYQKLESAV